MSHTQYVLTSLAATAAIGVAMSSNAATFSTGYTIDSGLLGSDLIFDNATHAGLSTFDARANDTGNGNGAYEWVATWEELWDIGSSVEITGIALPIRSPNTGTANNTANGTFTFSFYELTGGASTAAWDGTANGESLLATRDVEFMNVGDGAQLTVWAQFDTPITFNSASTGLAIGLDSTSSIRTRFDGNADTADGRLQNLISGTQATTQGVQWTLAGTPLWVPPGPPVAPYRFDAAVDEGGDGVWYSNEPAFELFSFEGGATPTPVAVNDPSVPGITAAYDVGAIGIANAYDPAGPGSTGQTSRQDATFEVWFKPDSLAGGDQVIFEVGGTGNGTYLSLQDDELTLFSNGQIDNTSASTTLTDSDWTQVVAVIHNTFSALPSADDFVELYINGQLVDDSSDALVDLNDWAGGNQAGIGQDAGNLAADGPLSGDVIDEVNFDFAGLISSVEYVFGALTAQEIMDRYLDVTTASSIAGDYSGDGFVSQADLDLVLLNWGDGTLPAGFDEGNLPGGGPFDGLVSQNELDGVLLNWGSGTAPSATAVPEPTTAGLLGLAGLALLRRRK